MVRVVLVWPKIRGLLLVVLLVTEGFGGLGKLGVIFACMELRRPC